ncbi:MAG: hypothetical protein ACKV22_34070 [Bryobacteraceae bacterium]
MTLRLVLALLVFYTPSFPEYRISVDVTAAPSTCRQVIFPEPWTPPGDPSYLAGTGLTYRILSQGLRRYILVGVADVSTKKFKVLFPGDSRAIRATDEEWSRAIPVEQLEVENQLRKYNADHGRPRAKLSEAFPWEVRWSLTPGKGVLPGCDDRHHGTFGVEFIEQSTGRRKGVIHGTYCGSYGTRHGEVDLDRVTWACDFRHELLPFVVLCDMK